MGQSRLTSESRVCTDRSKDVQVAATSRAPALDSNGLELSCMRIDTACSLADESESKNQTTAIHHHETWPVDAMIFCLSCRKIDSSDSARAVRCHINVACCATAGHGRDFM